MNKLEHLDLFSFRIIGEKKQVLLDSLISLHNNYVKAFQSKKVKWYGGMRLSVNDLCIMTGWGHNKVGDTLKELCGGIKHNNKTFNPVEKKETAGYYSINESELEKLCNYIESYKSKWKRDNEKWMAENKDNVFSIDEVLNIMATENYNLLDKRFRNNR